MLHYTFSCLRIVFFYFVCNMFGVNVDVDVRSLQTIEAIKSGRLCQAYDQLCCEFVHRRTHQPVKTT